MTIFMIDLTLNVRLSTTMTIVATTTTTIAREIAASGKTSDGSMIAIGNGAEMGINVRQHFLDEDLFDRGVRFRARRAAAGRLMGRRLIRQRHRSDGIKSIHDDEHGLGLAGVDEIVQDEIRVPLPRPIGLILPAAVH